MATAYIAEFADIAVTFAKYAAAPAAPGTADQTVSTSGSNAQSAAFNANTRIIMISTPAAQAIRVAFGANPDATAGGPRLPANSTFFFGVKPGHKVAMVDVT